MTIEGCNGPAPILVTPEVRLLPFEPKRGNDDVIEAMLPSYQDRETVRMVDGPNAEPCDLAKLKAMLAYMSKHGELYLIEQLTPGHGWIPIGDAGLQTQATPVVLSPDHRSRGSDNVASQRAYESLGFVAVEPTELGHRYRLLLT